MPDFYEYLQRPLGGGGDLLAVPRGLYQLPRRPLLLSDWPPYAPAAALPPAHLYYGYYATAAAASLVSSYLREPTTAPHERGVASSTGSSWVERPPAANTNNSGVAALNRRLYARGRRSLHLHSDVVVTCPPAHVGEVAAAAAAAAAAAVSPDGPALAAASARNPNMKWLNDEKQSAKANERWAAFNKQTYEKIVDATLKEMTSSSPSCEDQQRPDEDSQEEPPNKSPLAIKGHLQLARSITPIFRRSPGACRGREGLLRNRGHKGSSASSALCKKEEKAERQLRSPLVTKGRSEEPLDLSTHSARPAGHLLGLMACGANEQESAAPPGQSPLLLPSTGGGGQGPSVQTLHNWQSVRQSSAPSDPSSSAASAGVLNTTPRALWVRAQPSSACQLAHSGASKHCQTLSPALDRVGDGRYQQRPNAPAEQKEQILAIEKRDIECTSFTDTDATPKTTAQTVANSVEERAEMSSGIAMSSHGGLRAKEDLWVPLNKDTVLGLVNDVVDSMVSSELADRSFSGTGRSGPRTSNTDRTSSPPMTRMHPRLMRRTPHAPSTAKLSTVMDSQPSSLSCPPNKSTSQKENLHHSSRPRPPTSPAKGPAGRATDNVDRWVAITKHAMRNIVENAIRCELEGEEGATTPSDDRSDAPDVCSTKAKTEVANVSDVDYNANERPLSQEAPSSPSSSQGQSSSGKSSQKRTRSPSPRSPASVSEGNKRSKGEEGGTRSPPRCPLEKERASSVADKQQHPQTKQVPAGDRKSPSGDSKGSEPAQPTVASSSTAAAATSAATTTSAASLAVKGPSNRLARASPPCTASRRVHRAIDNAPIMRPASLPPVPLEGCSNKDRKALASPGPAFKSPQVCSGPLSSYEARRQLTAWVAVSKNMVNSMIDDILVDNTDTPSVTDESVTSPKTSDMPLHSTSSETSQGPSSKGHPPQGHPSQGHSQGHSKSQCHSATDLSTEQTKSPSDQCTGDQSTSDQSTSDQSTSDQSTNDQSGVDLTKTTSNTPPPPVLVPALTPVLPSSSGEQEPRPTTPRSPATSEAETTDSCTSSSDPVANNSVCKSSFKLKSAMLERFNEERKSSTSSPSIPSPVTSSSPSVTPSPTLTARSTPSPSSPATSKVKQTLSVSCDQEKAPTKAGPQNSANVAQKHGPKSKKGPRSRQAAATKDKFFQDT